MLYGLRFIREKNIVAYKTRNVRIKGRSEEKARG